MVWPKDLFVLQLPFHRNILKPRRIIPRPCPVNHPKSPIFANDDIPRLDILVDKNQCLQIVEPLFPQWVVFRELVSYAIFARSLKKVVNSAYEPNGPRWDWTCPKIGNSDMRGPSPMGPGGVVLVGAFNRRSVNAALIFCYIEQVD